MAPAGIGGPGYFISNSGCTENTSPVANKSVCWDAAAQTLKYWNGSAWTAVATGGSGSVSSVTGSAPIISSGGTSPVISLADSGVTPGSYTNANFQVDTKGRLTVASSGPPPVTSVSGIPPMSSTGGTTPAIGLSGVTSEQGNGAKVQLSTGTATSNHCVQFDANGNTTDAGAACGTGTGGVTSVTGTAPIASTGGTTPVISLNANYSVPGVVNPMDPAYGAHCDGTTDDTVAIQNASNAAFNGGKRLLIPGQCRVSSLNWTNRQGGQVEVAGFGASISKLLCRESSFNSGVCVDMTDTQRAVLHDFTITSEGATASGSCASTSTCAPKIVLLISDTVFAAGVNSQIYHLDGMNLENDGSAASSAGDYALYDYGGEILQASHFFFRGGLVAAAMFTVANTAGISSPYRGTLATPPTSMTTTSLVQGLVDARGTGAWGIIIEAPNGDQVGDFKMDGVYGNNPGPGLIEGIGGGIIHDLTLNSIRYEPQSTSAVFAQFAPQVQNIVMDNDTYAAGGPPVASVLQFNKTGISSVVGGHINIRPSDTQGNYGTPSVISCANGAMGVVFDSVDATGGGPLKTSGCSGLTINYRGLTVNRLSSTGSSPSVTGCGTTLTSGSTDTAGEIQGSGASSCVLTFAIPFTGNNVACTGTADGNAQTIEVSSKTNSSVTFSCLTPASGGGFTAATCGFISYTCIGFGG